MKNLKLSFIGLLILLMITSCSVTLQSTKMTEKYQKAMDSNETIKIIDTETGKKVKKSMRQIAETYKVYFKPSDIKNQYDVLAVHAPHVFVFPIFGSPSKALTKKLLPKSMKKCAELGGNAILVQTYNSCFIIKEK